MEDKSVRAFQQAVLVFSQAIAALAEMEAMEAENNACRDKGCAGAYGAAAFFAVPERFGLDRNSVLKTLRSMERE
jgi:hypothetical protein